MAGTNNEALHDDQVTEVIDDNAGQVDDQSQVEPVAPVNPPQQTQGDAPLSPRERELMNKARTEEKSKLYKEQQKMREKIAELERQLKTTPPRDPQGNSNNDDISMLRDEITTLRDELRESRNQSELSSYRAQRVAEIRQDGGDVVEAILDLNRFSTKEDIDLAIEIARAEYEMVADKERKKIQPRTNTVNGVSRNRPDGVPQAPRQPSQVGSDNESLSMSEVLNAIRGGAGVRDGSYARLRDKIHAHLRAGRPFRQA